MEGASSGEDDEESASSGEGASESENDEQDGDCSPSDRHPQQLIEITNYLV